MTRKCADSPSGEISTTLTSQVVRQIAESAGESDIEIDFAHGQSKVSQIICGHMARNYLVFPDTRRCDPIWGGSIPAPHPMHERLPVIVILRDSPILFL